MINDALLLEEIGCFSLVLEKIPHTLSQKVLNKIKIPIIGIGAGSNPDGQILVSHDMLGMNKDFSPRFLRRYLDLDTLISNAVKEYSKDIKKDHKLIHTLMGNDVVSRKDFIIENAINVSNLDV